MGNEQPKSKKNFADQLREDTALWDAVLQRTFPLICNLLIKQFGPAWHWLDPEGAAMSAFRTGWQHLQQRDNASLENLSAAEDLARWLVQTARNKYLEQLRHRGVEIRHFSRVGECQNEKQDNISLGTEESDRKTAEQVVAELRELVPEHSQERAVLEAKLANRTGEQIAESLGCSPRQVDRVWSKLKKAFQQAPE